MADTFTTGNATVSFGSDLEDFYTGFLDKVAPGAKKIIDETLKKIEEQAQKNWPKRKPAVRIHPLTKKIVFFREVSKNSYQKFERGFRIDANGDLVGFLKNTAPYAFTIKFGVDSENWQGKDIIFPTGRRVATELMVKPLRRGSRRVVKALADDLARKV
jgi:hypothetical protein